MNLGTTKWAIEATTKKLERFAKVYMSAAETLESLDGFINEQLLLQAKDVNLALTDLLVKLVVDVRMQRVTLFSELEPRGERLPLFDDLGVVENPHGSSSNDAEKNRQATRHELAEAFKAELGANGPRIFGPDTKAEFISGGEKVILWEPTPQPAPVAPEAKPERWGDLLKVIVQARYNDVRAAFEFSFLKRNPLLDPEGYTVLIGLPAFLGFVSDEQTIVVGEITAESYGPREWAEMFAGKLLHDQVMESEIAARQAERERVAAELAAEKADKTLLVNKTDDELDQVVAKTEAKLKAPKAWGKTGTIERENHVFAFWGVNVLPNGESEYPVEITHNGVSRRVMATEYEALNNDQIDWCDEYLMFSANVKQAAESAPEPATKPQIVPRKDSLLLDSLIPPDAKGDTGPARRRWDKRTADGASDAELQAAIANEYQRWTRAETEKRGFSVSAGAGFPTYWDEPFKAGKPATLKNAPLVDAVRSLLKIPPPIEPAPKAKAPKRDAAKTKGDSVRKGSSRA